MEVARVSVPVESSAPGGRTNAYVLGRDPAVLVDPGARTDELDEVVEDRGVEYVVCTHTHPDHVGALRWYANRHDLTTWALSDFADRFESATGLVPDATVVDGDRIHLGGESVRVIALAGHAADHVGIELPDDGPLCCGDCAIARGSVAIAGPDADMSAYLDSLRRLESLDPSALLPGHGPIIDHPSTTIQGLVHHRLRRENRIRRAVEAGARTIDEVLEASYDKPLDGVASLARKTVATHLVKLDDDGVVVWDGNRARPRRGRT
ncbi:MBL fold metallo-hydrolase [Halovivax gelatinilyticus]|uniref:MBL fold metallo-hydrolase n=1 Tax=Halovivax gelatinilyticus TaxID=2961597 RepID=UPI0020CA9B1E|nr:MBL fold metallo-hydrolase [Halovivax gelatinilyticus]